MKILAVDTSTTSCSVAMVQDEQLLVEEIYTAGQTHSGHLMSMIDRILERCGIGPEAIDGIAVTRGPGTFTGLRIGISTVKGLAVATSTPVVGINSLAALAFPFSLVNRPVVPMIDARRGEVYHVEYRCIEGKFMPIQPVVVSSPETAALALPENAILVGSGTVLYHRLFESRCPTIQFANPTQHVIRAVSVAMIGLDRLRLNDVDPIEAMAPEYIRQSDAQVQMGGQ